MSSVPPSPLERLCAWALPSGAPPATSVRFQQEGEIRLAPGKPWLPLRATQTMDARAVSFAWHARARMGLGLRAHVCDAYEGRAGRLTVKLWGIVPISRVADEATSLAQALRYLAEIPWCPAALRANPHLELMDLNAKRLRVATPSAGGRAEVELSVDDEGRVYEVRAAARPRAVHGTTIPTPWGGRFDGERCCDGVRIPAEAEVWWDLDEGRFSYFRARIVDFACVADATANGAP